MRVHGFWHSLPINTVLPSSLRQRESDRFAAAM
jgi:hypothetical protein